MAELDRRGLVPSSRNRKTCSIKALFAPLTQSGFLRKNVAAEIIPPTIPHNVKFWLVITDLLEQRP